MLAHTVGQFFCMWRGFLLDEIKSEDLFKVQQQSLKGTERSESMCDLQHKQVPQQVPSAHAPTERSQTRDLLCPSVSHTTYKVKVSRSVTSSHRCPQLRVFFYIIPRPSMVEYIVFLLLLPFPSSALFWFACLTCLIFLFFFFINNDSPFPSFLSNQLLQPHRRFNTSQP